MFDSCFSGGMDDLAGSGRVVATACGEREYSYDGTSDMENGVWTWFFMQGLSQHDSIEGAFDYSDTLAHDFIYDNYGARMNPQLYDRFTGDWTFGTIT